MKQLIISYLPYLLSAITIYSVFLQGNLNKLSWLISLVNQGLWFTWIIVSEQYGFVPMNMALTILFFINYFKWKKKFG